MDRNAYRDDDGGEEAGQPDAYWRRRVITLALGLGLLGMLAWGFSGGGGKAGPSGSSGILPAAALGTAVPGLPGLTGSTSSPQAGSSAASGAAGASGTPSASPGAGPTGPTGTATASGSPGATPSQSPARSASSPQARRSPAPAPAAPAGGRCAPGAVVLSLFTDRSSYAPAQLPRFDVYAVSTSAGSCAFDPGQLQVVVLSSGRIVWDSADCARGNGRVAELTRGVPAQDSVVWNRAITLPGCQVLAPAARPGSYTVQARTATVQSPARTFKLTG